MGNRAIIVNATACDSGGALTVLRQFLANIPDDSRRWLVFVPENFDAPSRPRVTLVPMSGVKSWTRRFMWDTFGLARWLKKHNIKPVAKLSLQNTGFNAGSAVPSFIYYHQPIPLYPCRWNPIDRRQRKMWFYKNIYPLFVKLFLNRDTHVFVQLNCIKDLFAKRFNHPHERITVCAPTIDPPETHPAEPSETLTLLYPAADYLYKNHSVLTQAITRVSRPLKLIFTTSALPCGADPRIIQLGNQPYEAMRNLYATADALLFPSYIETFGLPLLEAASIGLPIIAADLPYARELLAGYQGAIFVPHNSPRAWATAIRNLQPGSRPPFTPTHPTWPTLFNTLPK